MKKQKECKKYVFLDQQEIRIKRNGRSTSIVRSRYAYYMKEKEIRNEVTFAIY